MGQRDERLLLAIKYINTIDRYNENPFLEEMHGSLWHSRLFDSHVMIIFVTSGPESAAAARGGADQYSAGSEAQ